MLTYGIIDKWYLIPYFIILMILKICYIFYKLFIVYIPITLIHCYLKTLKNVMKINLNERTNNVMTLYGIVYYIVHKVLRYEKIDYLL
jgi:hypothetical protein